MFCNISEKSALCSFWGLLLECLSSVDKDTKMNAYTVWLQYWSNNLRIYHGALIPVFVYTVFVLNY